MNHDHESLPVGTTFEHEFSRYQIVEVRPRHYLVRITSRRETKEQVFAHRFIEEWHADSLARGIATQVGRENTGRFRYLPKDRDRDPNEA